jgi:hypothetical protein
MLSITSPKDGRTLRIFRCECGKLTSAEDRRSVAENLFSLPRHRQDLF